MSKRFKLGVLGSGKGSNFRAIYGAIETGQVRSSVALVASDREGSGILEFAENKGLPTFLIGPNKYKTKLEPEIEASLAGRLLESGADLIVLAGYMRVLKKPLLDAFPGKILNIHPSLLPLFPGLNAWEQALSAGAGETGCTVHWVNETVDGGEIIDQEKIPVLPGDTPETLHARIQEKEHILYPRVIAMLESQ